MYNRNVLLDYVQRDVNCLSTTQKYDLSMQLCDSVYTWPPIHLFLYSIYSSIYSFIVNYMYTER